MRWCCGSGGNHSNNGSGSPSTVHDSGKHTAGTTQQPSTMMTELSLKSGKNSTKLSKNRGHGGGSKKSNDDTALSANEKHCVFQQGDDERQVTQVLGATSGGDTNTGRPGVLKSSLKILQSRNAPKTTKGVQYADEVQAGGGAHISPSDNERARLLHLESDADERMDVVCGIGGRSGKEFPAASSSESDMQKKVIVDSDGRTERNDKISKFHNYSSSNNRQSPSMAGRFATGGLLKGPQVSSACSSPLYDKYGPMLVRTCKTAVYIGPTTLPVGTPDVLLPLSGPTSASSPSLPRVFEHLQRAGWTIYMTNRASSTYELQTRRPVLVLVDEHVDDFANFITSLRAQTEYEDALISALFESKEHATRFSLPYFLLHSSTDIALYELFARLTSRLRAMPALFAVIEEAEQPIKICDENNIAQYVNRAYEYATGRTRNDVLGSDASEMREKSINNFAASNAWSWNSSSSLLPRPPTVLETVSSSVNTVAPPTPVTQSQSPPAATPISHPGALTEPSGVPLTTTVGSGAAGAPSCSNAANRRRSSEWHCITVPSCSTVNPQFVYVKRGSADAIGRDLSLKSLRSQSALVEAPITEALNVLDTVLHRCAEDEATQMQVRDAIKILSTAELYAPTITRFRDNDRIASGYYDGLIRLHHPSRQRKRSVVDVFRENQQRRVSAGSNISSLSSSAAGGSGSEGVSGGAGSASSTAARRRISADVVNALENESSWNFDVIELERITEHRPLSHLGLKIFERWDVPNLLRCSPDILTRWLQVIEANYQAGNAYHNATHAADVLQATSFFLSSDAVGQYVQSQHALAALLAATVHDLDHPGRGNAFLMNTRSRLAVLYNDHSVLENHHVALAFQLTLTQPGVNIFVRMPEDEFVQLRQATIDMVLATDMSRHFEYLTKFQQLLGVLPSDVEENRDANSLTICRMMIKCADIANPTREWKLCYQWAMRIVVEYFEQTAEEVEKGLPLTMKGFDCSTCNIPLTQCTFVDMFAREAFTSWCEFAELPHLLIQLESNYERWKAQSADWDSNQNSTVLQLRQGGVGRL